MQSIPSLVESELGASYTPLIASAISHLAIDNNEAYSPMQVINLAWKAKQLIDVNREILSLQSTDMQRTIIKRYLAGSSVVEWLEITTKA